MYIASNDIKKYMPHPGWKIYIFQNTLMTSHECGATLTRHPSPFQEEKTISKLKDCQIFYVIRILGYSNTGAH